MRPIVIGITGLAHSGKDTSADYLITQLQRGHTVVKVALANQLKVICQKLVEMFTGTSIPLEDFYDLDKKEMIRPELPPFAGQPFKLRTVLQRVGTEVFRDLLSTSVWCNYVAEHNIRSSKTSTDVIVISDIRMPDEIQYFHQLCQQQQLDRVITLRITRPNRQVIDQTNQLHSTEALISSLPVDHEINNQDTLDQLYRQLDDFLQRENLIN
uniref:Deoxynucleoside monophosphate kinase n=1 Tax=viral metagenome TaxID=1070528 RepID=A0A6C0BK18_9ZZZZ